jgi:hypothetical protein
MIMLYAKDAKEKNISKNNWMTTAYWITNLDY